MSSAAAAEPKRPKGINARLVLSTIRRRPLALAAVLLLAGASAVLVWLFMPLPKTTAEAVFHVAIVQPSLLAPNGEGRVDHNSYKQSQVALLKRRLTLSAALKQPGVSDLELIRKAEPDPLTWLDQRLKVDTKGNSEFMRVSIDGDDGEELRTLLAAVTKSYLSDVDDRDNGGRRKRLARLEDTNKTYRTELEGYQNRIDKIAKVVGSKEGPTLVALDSVLQEELRAASRDYSQLRDQLQLAELEAAAADKAVGPAQPLDAGPPAKAPPVAVPQSLIDEELRKDPALQRLEADVTQARQALVDTEALFEKGKTSPQITRAKEQVKAAEDKRDRYRTDRGPQLEEAVRESIRRAQQRQSDEARVTVERTKQKADLARGRLEEAQQRIARMGEYRIDLENLKRSMEQGEKVSTRLADEIEQVKVELGSPLRVALAEEPYVVPGIEGNKKLKFALIVAGAVFVLGFAGLVGWEYRSRRVTHPDEVTTHLGLRLLGTVPPPPGGGAGHERDEAALVEAIDTTRTMVLHNAKDLGGLRTLLVTSATSGEGKTTFSGHLAISLARAGYRTLLVDGDFHAPSAHLLFGLPEGAGLCEVLREEVRLADAVQPSRFPGLSILPAGTWDLATRQSLIGDRWRAAKRAMEAQYDFVVIDSAPLLLVADTLLLAKEVDGVVLSVLLGASQVALVTETAAKLQSVNAKVLGTVVNGVVQKSYRKYHAYPARAATKVVAQANV